MTKIKPSLGTNLACRDTSDCVTSFFLSANEPTLLSLFDARCSKLPKQEFESFHCQDLYSDTPLIHLCKQKTTCQRFAFSQPRKLSLQANNASFPKYCLHSDSYLGPRQSLNAKCEETDASTGSQIRNEKRLQAPFPTQTLETSPDRE